MFDVYFPRAETKPADMVVIPSETSPTGSERILLIDDEEPVIRVTDKILKNLGYDVTAVQNSQEALTLFRSDPDQFDLVITDTTMPKMTGVELSEALMTLRADLPIILCTGYSEKISQKKADALGVKGLLMKPITKSEMATMVRQALDTS